MRSATSRVECSPDAPHRDALIVRMASLVAAGDPASTKARLAGRWFPVPLHFTSSVFGALVEWPPESETIDCLLHALVTGEGGNRLAAATTLRVLARHDSRIRASVEQIARRASSDVLAVAAARSVTWDEDTPAPAALAEATRAWRTGVPEWQVVSAGVIVRAGIRAPELLHDLLWLLDDGILMDSAFRPLVARGLTRGWAGHIDLRDALLPDGHHYNGPRGTPDGARPQRQLAYAMLLESYVNDPAVAEWCAQELVQDFPFIGLHRNWATFLSKARPGSELARLAVGRVLHRPGAEWERAVLATGLRVDELRDALCRDALESEFPRWAVGALLDTWGMEEEPVRSTITRLLAAGPDRHARVAEHLARLVPDSRERTPMVIAALSAADRTSLLPALNALAELPDLPDTVATEALRRMDDLPSVISVAFYRRCLDRRDVRQHLLARLENIDTDWGSIARVATGDAVLRAVVRNALPRLDVPGRRVFVGALRDRGESAVYAMRSWAREADDHCRCRAAAEIGRRGGLNHEELTRAIMGELDGGGFLHRTRFATGLALAMATRRLDLFVSHRDYAGRPSRLEQHSYDPNMALWEEVATNWEDVESALGDHLWTRLDPDGGSDGEPSHAIEFLAAVADRHPRVVDAILRVLEQWHPEAVAWLGTPHHRYDENSPGQALRSNVLELLARVRPRSVLLRDLSRLILRGHRGWPDALTAARLVADRFARDDEMHREVLERARGGSTIDRLVVGLAWPEEVWSFGDRLGRGHGSLEDAIAVSVERPEEVEAFVEGWALTRFDQNPYVAEAMALVLRRRLARDPAALDHLATRWMRAIHPSYVATLGHLLVGLPLSIEARTWAVATLDGAHRAVGGPVVGFDGPANRFRPIIAVLEEVIWGTPT